MYFNQSECKSISLIYQLTFLRCRLHLAQPFLDFVCGLRVLFLELDGILFGDYCLFQQYICDCCTVDKLVPYVVQLPVLCLSYAAI